MLPKHVRYQTALHPVCFKPIQATKVIIHKLRWIVKREFRISSAIFASGQRGASRAPLFNPRKTCYDNAYVRRGRSRPPPIPHAETEDDPPMKRLSIIVPCYNEEEAIPLFYTACAAEVAKLPAETEWWFVDDGSRDGTLAALKALREKDPRAHYITFSRNFGKEAGMTRIQPGDYLIVLSTEKCFGDVQAELRQVCRGAAEAGGESRRFEKPQQ